MSYKITVRKSEDRGHANHRGINTHHTFSFANYYDISFQNFGSLNVINEDIVAPTSGFGTHPHREFEIFSYIISGELQHKDSMDNVEILKRGDIQFTTAGTGIFHSEYNIHTSLPVHFLQIWVKPDDPYLTPSYHTKTFPDSVKLNNLVHIISPADSTSDKLVDQISDDDKSVDSTIKIHTDFHMFASILEPGRKVVHKVRGTSKLRRIYVHLTSTGGELKLNDEVSLKQGDGAFVTDVKNGDEISFESVGAKNAEFVVFDLQ